MKYFLVAGEASGDLHASNLMASLKKVDSNAEFCFLGGDLMQAQGGRLVKHYREMAFMGFIPVLLNLKTILRNMKMCQEEILKYQPDVVILIDYPGFNLKIAKFVKQNTSIPVHYYISPKVWAWKEYRVKSFKKYVDKMLCILPFEVEFFKKHQYKVDYVGNPTVDAIDAFKKSNEEDSFEKFLGDNKLQDKPIVALLAGSRKQEIKDNLPSMLEVVKQFPTYQAVIAGAPGIDRDYYKDFIGDDSEIVFDQTYRLLSHSAAALVTSGTATLETSLFRVPQVVCYKTPIPKVVYWVFKTVLTTKYISLVNLMVDRTIVQELFAKFFSVKNIQAELDRILNDDEYRQKMLLGYDDVIEVLGKPGASEKAANVIVKSLLKTGH